MASIFWSVLSIALITGVGWLARRTGALGAEAAPALASVAYSVATPAMLFHAVVSSDTSGVVGPPLAVAVASGVGSAVFFALVARFVLRLRRGEVALGAMAASLTKLIIQPALACAVGSALGLGGSALMAVTVMAALPSAQNAYIAATRARAGERIAQGTVLATTALCLPVVIAVAALFHGLGLVS